MSITLGNMGTFDTLASVGYIPKIKEGNLMVTLMISDGNGSSSVLAHEDAIDVDGERALLFEGHAREIIYQMSRSDSLPINLFTLAHKLEHISAMLSNSQVSSGAQAVLTAPEGSIVTIRSENDYSDKTRYDMPNNYFKSNTNRYSAAVQWDSMQKKTWQRKNNMILSLGNGVSEQEIERIYPPKK
ncbi:MAG: hypothetical protein H9W81_18455 [Enterococcus sp.]|nr:hypothetical protein [Enterococcus sp.]